MPRPTPEAVDAGRELIGRFNDAINRRDLDQFRSLWTEDAIWDIKTMSAATGPQAITELIASMLQNWEVFFQLSGEPVFEADGQTLVARSPMWEFGRSHTGSSYSGYALNVDEIVRGEQG
jgi:ketosteroid isomerase-like protein